MSAIDLTIPPTSLNTSLWCPIGSAAVVPARRSRRMVLAEEVLVARTAQRRGTGTVTVADEPVKASNDRRGDPA